MTDSARQIENLIYTYADRLDSGDLDGVAAPVRARSDLRYRERAA